MRLPKETEAFLPDMGHRRENFVLAIPSLGMVPLEFCIALCRLQMPVNSISTSLFFKGCEIGEARNRAAEFVINSTSKPDYLLFLGDDMIPPWDSIIKLFTEMETQRWDILSGLYYAKQDPPFAVMWRKDVIGPLQVFKHYQPGEVISVDVCGMDFTLIKTNSFKKLCPPYFQTGPSVSNKNGQFMANKYTEDVFFCDKAKRAGLNIGVHTGIRIAHYLYKTGEVF